MLRLLLAAVLFVENPRDVDSSPIWEVKKVREDLLIMALQYMEDNPETLEELMSKDYAVLEGDMILSHDRNAVERTWPTREIPYVVSPELAGRTDHILSAMAMVSEQTCLSFHNRTAETNYLHFKTSKGCASYVGFIGGEQAVFIGPPCIVGNIAHEILHALGFHHEHTRADRERYITILTHNIMAGMERNFKKQEGKTFDLPYDIASIMHYGRKFFSANGLPTIVPNEEQREMGQRVKMTKLDVERVRLLYHCDAPEKQTETEKISGHAEEEEEEDANIHVMVQTVSVSFGSGHQSHVPSNKPEENLSPTTAAPAASLPHLDAATGRRHNTSGQRA
ncbi:astacin-like metalloendopeptidase [Xiphias gladius]|uniref:astacin-like metalloendopeptidase n=1 Tax=Xiphias gladius TaxID=8245 RepID=UPI001A9A275B|nr:astacin-like metalloendopeptidase [Xiphias gladius]